VTVPITHHILKHLTLIVCLAAIGIIGCKKEDPGLKALPGRRMVEMEVVSLTGTVFPQQVGYSYHTSFKDGIWEVSCKTNKAQVDWEVIARIRDADGVVVQTNQP
jgi:hypothetical protein